MCAPNHTPALSFELVGKATEGVSLLPHELNRGTTGKHSCRRPRMERCDWVMGSGRRSPLVPIDYRGHTV